MSEVNTDIGRVLEALNGKADLDFGNTDLAELENDNGTLIWNGGAVSVPAGTVIAYAANSAPNGFLICNGAAVSRTTYANLFAVIGTTYGTGNGSTTFNVPNLTDKFIQGSGTAGTSKAAGLPNITGTFRYMQNLNNSFNATGAFNIDSIINMNDANSGTTSAAQVSLNASRSSSIYGNSTTVQPPALTMRYYIKY
jgi:microcystin-dependent protein